MMQIIPVILAGLAVYAVALWNPVFLQNLPGSGIVGQRQASYLALALIALIVGALAQYIMAPKSDMMAYVPVLVAARAVVALGAWGAPAFSRVPGGGRDVVLAGGAILLGLLALYFVDKQ